ncbi:MAG: winged helix-turn-helix domain-containing protein [Xanthobacteraceae bacterium]|nr:winged helix-turn-helix domain-containing protein [Xanthobacteraceae bacterium]
MVVAECLSLNRDTLRVSCGDRDLGVSLRSFQILELLIENWGKLVTRDEIRQRIWGTTEIDDRSINTEIRRVRRAMGRVPQRCAIRTVKSEGYILGGPVRTAARSKRQVGQCPPSQ